jgi:UDP-glucose 4-epimerase
MTQLSGKVLITGGLGYVGGRIATHLTDASSSDSIRLMTRRNADRVPAWAKGMDVAETDVLDDSGLQAALESINTVIHLAAANEIECGRDPDLALEVNGRGTHRLLEASRMAGVKRFIYFSTFHVYGPGALQPITELTPTRPIHPYAITHHLAEDFVNWYRHSYGMDTLILRLSNGYGYPADPWVERWTLVFNDFCRQAVETGEIRLRSTGLQHRDFISLTDVSRCVAHMLELPSEKWGDGLFNLGGECSLPIIEVARLVAAEYSSCYGVDVAVIPGDSDDSNNAHPVQFSIKKLKATGFEPTGSLSHEIRRTFEISRQLAKQKA